MAAATVLALLTFSPAARAAPSARVDADVVVTVDRGTSTATPPLGITVTGYGNQAYITNDATHRGHLARLAPTLMRIELAYQTPGDTNSRVVCGASFCDTAVDGAAWVKAIRDLGAQPMVILPLDGRRTADLDVAEAVALYRFLAAQPGGAVKRFIVGNETDNAGNPHAVTAVEYSRRFNLVTDALRAIDPTVVMIGPATASYRDAIPYIDTFLAGSGSRVDVVDVHRYGQGGADSRTDDELLGSVVDAYTTELADLRRRIDTAVPARKGQIGIQVGEYHLDWDGDPRTLTGLTTVWAAAVTGAILAAGAVPVQYGDKNGQLGLTSENGEGPYARNEPLPIYHGLGMFTTVGRFGPRTAAVTTTDPQVRAYASDTTVVLVNTSTQAKPTRVDLPGVAAADLWQTTGAAAQRVTGHTVTPAGIGLTLPARSVSTLVLTMGAGLRGTYFTEPDLTGPVLDRIDPTVNFDWGQGAPAAAVGADSFSVRWQGRVRADAAGAYTFTTTSDDGVRLWIDDTLVVDAWNDHSTRDDSGTITLGAGQHRIRMEYYDSTFDAVAKLSWTPPGGVRQIVPTTSLSP